MISILGEILKDTKSRFSFKRSCTSGSSTQVVLLRCPVPETRSQRWSRYRCCCCWIQSWWQSRCSSESRGPEADQSHRHGSRLSHWRGRQSYRSGSSSCCRSHLRGCWSSRCSRYSPVRGRQSYRFGSSCCCCCSHLPDCQSSRWSCYSPV